MKSTSLKETILQLNKYGFKNIELSGGTEYYDDLENDLLDLKAKYNLQYICHNYFPPPKEHFVLNLASLNDEIYEKSIGHLINAVKISSRLGAKKFGFHAGYLIDINLDEIGNKLKQKKIYEKEKATERFCKAIKLLYEESGNLKLYIENNVYSLENKLIYKESNPLLLANYDDYVEFRKKIDFNLLLDVAHLKVSCKSLEKDFPKELDMLIKETDYIHISENDGLRDQNQGIAKESDLLNLLSRHDLSNYTITLEIYDRLHEINESFNNVAEAINHIHGN